MGKIVRLSTHLANMIAAGEVVEKPASVVKELVENSIDAHSTSITISLIDSGIKEINVIDNGIGMSSEDALEAFGRHSTSKIKSEYDLARISSLGFRGEAIPSIASVSNIRILTNDGSGGFEVVYKAGNYISSSNKACSIGTNIMVKDLFFNTPARLKYLKNLSSELAAIVFLVGRFALSHPNIAFTLTNNKKEIIKTSGNNDIVRLFGELYGLEVAKNLIFNEFNGFGYKFKIVLVKPQVTRTTRNEMTIITNGRFVKSNLLTNAIIEGYHTYLPVGRYPIACMYLDIDPLLIDVNVHPSKQIIKISNEEEITQILSKLVVETLNGVNNIPKALVIEEQVKPQEYKKETIFGIVQENISYEPKKEVSPEKLFQEENVEYVMSKPVEVKKDHFPYMEYIGQAHGTYLLFQNEEGLLLVDQHAAAERIRYEYYYDLLQKQDVVRKSLLIPYNLEFTKEEMLYIEDNTDKFLEIGFMLEQSGINSYFLREVPSWADFDDLEDIVRKIINMMIINKNISVMNFRDGIAKQISCKSSIKANKALSKTEIDELISKLSLCKNPYNCPHGRPVLVKITSYDLEKMFKRVM